MVFQETVINRLFVPTRLPHKHGGTRWRSPGTEALAKNGNAKVLLLYTNTKLFMGSHFKLLLIKSFSYTRHLLIQDLGKQIEKPKVFFFFY